MYVPVYKENVTGCSVNCVCVNMCRAASPGAGSRLWGAVGPDSIDLGVMCMRARVCVKTGQQV